MGIKRIAASFFLVSLCAFACAAQDAAKCNLTLAQLPQAEELRGFHLGMTVEQVKARIPKLPLAVDAYNVAKTSISPDFNKDVDKASLQGVRTVSFEFLDDRLFSLGIAYNGAFKWQRMEEFLPQMSKALRLPLGWQSRGWHGQELDCKDFQATVRMIGESPSLVLLDKTSKEILDKRIAEKEEAEP